MDIQIDNSKCIKCKKCVNICPAHIFVMDKEGIGLINKDTCIVCGHCVGVCPQEAVLHSEFPKESIHSMDSVQMPSAEQFLSLCRYRRSNRAFSDKEIPQEFLDMILEAAYRAPSARNAQMLEFTVVKSPEKLWEISNYTLSVFKKIAKKLNFPLVKLFMKPLRPDLYKLSEKLLMMAEMFDRGDDMILRNAKAVILFHAPQNDFGRDDANLAYQNASLMAEVLGVGHFYTGFVCSAIRNDKSENLAKTLGISGQIYAGMALGMTKFKFINYIDRKKIKLNLI